MDESSAELPCWAQLAFRDTAKTRELSKTDQSRSPNSKMNQCQMENEKEDFLQTIPNAVGTPNTDPADSR